MPLTPKESGGSRSNRVYPYKIEYSGVFTADTKLDRTVVTTGNRQKAHFHLEIKVGDVRTGIFPFYNCGNTNATLTYIGIIDGQLFFYSRAGADGYLVTSALFIDTTAHYSIDYAIDTTQAVESDRLKIWVNGKRITEFDTETYPALDKELNLSLAGLAENVGYLFTNSNHFDGYISNFHYVDGAALKPEDFGVYSSLIPGLWVPQNPQVADYGTNGFWLNFTNASNMGDDNSTNARDFTDSGVAIKQSVDTQTNNYATLNPMIAMGESNQIFSSGMLSHTNSGANQWCSQSWFKMLPGNKYYFEGKQVEGVNTKFIGITTDCNANGEKQPGSYSGSFGWQNTANRYWENGTYVTPNDDGYVTLDDVVMVAVDLVNMAVWFGKNGVWNNGATQAEIESGDTTNAVFSNIPVETYYASVSEVEFETWLMDFGQNGFSYSMPQGFLKQCTANITEPDEHVISEYYHESLIYTDAYCSTSLINSDGLSIFGNMTSAGGNAAAFDGDMLQSAGVDAAYGPGETTGVVGLDLGAGNSAVWQGAVCTSTNNAGFWGQNNPTGMWLEMCGTNDDPNDNPNWIILGTSETFNDASANLGKKVIKAPNETPYRAYCIRIRSTDDYGLGPAIAEVEFSETVPEFTVNVDWDAENTDWLIVLRANGTERSMWFDTKRGLDKWLTCPGTYQEYTTATPITVSGQTITLPSEMLLANTTYQVFVFRVAPEAGFDIQTYTGDGVSGRLVQHNLDSTPVVVINRCRIGVNTSWITYTKTTGPTKYMYIDGSAAASTAYDMWNNTEPNADSYCLSGLSYVNSAGATFVSYLFAESWLYALAEYTGNGNVDGSYINMNAPILALFGIRNTQATSYWEVATRTANPNNTIDLWWTTTENSAWYTTPNFVFTSNGIKLITTSAFVNGNGQIHTGLVVKGTPKYNNAY